MSQVCKACGGTGVASNGNACYPCSYNAIEEDKERDLYWRRNHGKEKLSHKQRQSVSTILDRDTLLFS